MMKRLLLAPILCMLLLGSLPLNTFGQGTGRNVAGSDLGVFGMNIPGVSYIQEAKDRLGRDISKNVGAFGNAVLRADRGWSLGKGGQGGVGVLYY